MTPRLSINDLVDRDAAYAEPPGYVHGSVSSPEAPDGLNICDRQSDLMMASLGRHVSHVGPSIPKPKVSRVTAGPAIAAVTDESPLGDVSISKSPRQPMRGGDTCLAGDTEVENSIPVGSNASCPVPALGLFSAVNLFPESLFQCPDRPSSCHEVHISRLEEIPS